MRRHPQVKFALAGTLVLALAGASIPAASAVQTPSESSASGASQVDETLKTKADGFVFIENGEFVVSSDAESHLTAVELDSVNSAVTSINGKIADSKRQGFAHEQSGDTIRFSEKTAQPSSGSSMASASAVNGGVTKVETKWWGFEVYLSNADAVTATAGISLGGIWIPEPIISKAFASLGIVGAQALARDGRGIQFNWNALSGPNLTSVRWQ